MHRLVGQLRLNFALSTGLLCPKYRYFAQSTGLLCPKFSADVGTEFLRSYKNRIEPVYEPIPNRLHSFDKLRPDPLTYSRLPLQFFGTVIRKCNIRPQENIIMRHLRNFFLENCTLE